MRWRNAEDAEARYQEQEEADGRPCLQGVKDDDEVDDEDEIDDDDIDMMMMMMMMMRRC